MSGIRLFNMGNSAIMKTSEQITMENAGVKIMDQKHYTEVLIDGVVYTLAGTEEEAYLQKVAAYLNEKIGQVKKIKGFGHLSADDRALLIQLNVSDDYFKEQDRADFLAEQKAALEKDAYSLKHEVITTQMKLESVQNELETEKKRVQELQRQIDGMKAEQEQKKALQAAAVAVANRSHQR